MTAGVSLRRLLVSAALLGILATGACADTETESSGGTVGLDAPRQKTEPEKPRSESRQATPLRPRRDSGVAAATVSGGDASAAGAPGVAAGSTPPPGTARPVPASHRKPPPPPGSDREPSEPARRPTERGDLPLDGHLSATCAEHGDTLTVTLRTRPNASIAGVVEYVDEQAHGAMTVGNADAGGRFVWRFVVTPDAPLGDATAWVSAQDRSPGPDEYSGSTTGEQAAGEYPFEVREQC